MPQSLLHICRENNENSISVTNIIFSKISISLISASSILLLIGILSFRVEVCVRVVTARPCQCVSSIRAATALAPTGRSSVEGALTDAAASLRAPGPQSWASTARMDESLSTPSWWSSRASANTDAHICTTLRGKDCNCILFHPQLSSYQYQILIFIVLCKVCVRVETSY